MEQKLIKFFSAGCLALALASCLLLFVFTDIHGEIVLAREQRQKERQEQMEIEELSQMSGLELMKYYTAQKENGPEEEASFPQQLRLELPEGVEAADLEIENDYVGQFLNIHIPTEDKEYFYHYPLIGKSSHIVDLNLMADGSQASLEIALDGVYELETEQDGAYVYVDFIAPKERYHKIVVVDAGHGGSDPGAVGGSIYEKDIDLAILLKLKDLFDAQEDIKVYYTRTEDENPSLYDRARLANAVDADLFLSIHNNSIESGSGTVSGTEVMYNETEEADGFGSEEFARICLEEVCAKTGSTSLGLKEGSGIYIIRESEPPVALVEVGFMSDPEELEKLSSGEYQQQTAESLYAAVLRAYEEGL